MFLCNKFQGSRIHETYLSYSPIGLNLQLIGYNKITSNERTFKKIIRRKRKTLFPFFLPIFLRFIIPITVQESIHLFIYHIIYNSNFSTRERVRRKSIRRVRETLFPLPPLPPPNSPYFHTLFYSTTVPSHTPLCTRSKSQFTSYNAGIAIYLRTLSPPCPAKKPPHPSPSAATSATRSSATRKHETCTTSGDNIRRHPP